MQEGDITLILCLYGFLIWTFLCTILIIFCFKKANCLCSPEFLFLNNNIFSRFPSSNFLGTGFDWSCFPGLNPTYQHYKAFDFYLSARSGCRSSDPGFVQVELHKTRRRSPLPPSSPGALSPLPDSGSTPTRTKRWTLTHLSVV